MEDSLDFTDINTHLDSIIKKGQEIYDYLLIPLIDNQHPSELENVRALKNQHNLEVDRIKAEFHNELKKLNDARTEQSEKNRKIIFEKESELKKVKSELVEIRKANEKPKGTFQKRLPKPPISSEYNK